MPNENWERLGQYVKARREALNLTQQDVQAEGGPSAAKQREVENGRTEVLSESKRRDLERALEWPPGAIDEILNGGEAPVTSDYRAIEISAPHRGSLSGRFAIGEVDMVSMFTLAMARHELNKAVQSTGGVEDPAVALAVKQLSGAAAQLLSEYFGGSVASSDFATALLDASEALKAGVPLPDVPFDIQLQHEKDSHAEPTDTAAPSTATARTPRAGDSEIQEDRAGVGQPPNNVHALNWADQGAGLDSDAPPELDDEDVAARETPDGYEKGQPTPE